jgi:hypothetical protein
MYPFQANVNCIYRANDPNNPGRSRGLFPPIFAEGQQSASSAGKSRRGTRRRGNTPVARGSSGLS